jgi:hypothetical protein
VRKYFLSLPKTWLTLTAVLLAAACSKSSPTQPTGPSVTPPQLTAPALETPSDDQQLSTLRPELTVKNGTTNQATGTRTYEFQIADNTGFSPVAISTTGVAENAAGKTSFTPAQDLQPTTRMYWRARMVQGTTNSDWSTVGKFKTRLVGFNRPGELYDPLVHGETVGTPVGAVTFVPDKGIRLNDIFSYVLYQLPQTIPAGEISMEVEGLRPNGPGGKPKIFQMLDSANSIPSASSHMINAQYRGTPGNPDNSVAFKAVLGSTNSSSIVEPDLARRNQSRLMLDPSRTYFWQGIWDAKSFRLVVREDGPEGAVLYDYKMTGSGSGAFGPSPHYVFLGSNYERFTALTGTFPGMTVRNVWVGSRSRPASLGSALRAAQ